MEYRRDLDGLRALAVVPVVLHHALPELVPGGYVGVDVFFVISGFLIGGILRAEIAEGQFSILNFYERRIRRLLPALFIVLLFSVVVGSALLLPSDLIGLAHSTLAALLFVPNFYFLAEVNYFAAPAESYPLLHLWSLAVEEQFYIVVPLLLLALRHQPGRLALVVMASLSALSMLCSIILVEFWPKAAFYMLPSRFWELGVGVLLTFIRPSAWPSQIHHAASWLGGALILAACAILDENSAFPGLASIMPVVGAALLIWSGPQAQFGRVLGTRLPVWIGLISYPLYLWHWPLLSFVSYQSLETPSAFLRIATIALSILLAYLTLIWVERPIRARRGSFRLRSAVFRHAFAVEMLLATASIGLLMTGGWPERWTPEARYALRSGWDIGKDAHTCRLLETGPLAKRACIAGPETRTPNVIVWGDSHAGAMRAGFAKLSAELDISIEVISYDACMGLSGAHRLDMPIWHDCQAHNDRVLQEIKRTRPTVVVLISRWTKAEAYQFLPEGGKPAPLSAQLPFLRQGSFESAVERTIADLGEMGVPSVLWMRTVPAHERPVPERLAQSTERGQTAETGVAREADLVSQQHADSAFSRFPAVTAISPAARLCERERCRTAAEGKALYNDDNHLSPAGARYLATEFAPALERLLKERMSSQVARFDALRSRTE